MFFYAVTSSGPPGVVLKPEPERRGFEQPLRGLADVSVSENHV